MVIDTCIFIEHLRAKDRTSTKLASLPKGEVPYVSVISIFELYCGASSPDKKRDIIALTEDLNVLQFDIEVAAKAGEIYRALKRKNKNIGVADVMIAATCLVNNEPILTSNKKDFKLVDELNIL